MKYLLSILSFLALVAVVQAQTPTPTPPPHKPFTLDWSDNPPAENVQFYNVYKKVASLYVYQASVFVPAPSEWTIPANTPTGTIFAVTADNGNLESARSSDGVVPIGPTIPVGVKIIISFP